MAVTVDVGKCEQCGTNNLRKTSTCRQCGAPLPWAKAPKTKISTTSRMGLDNIAWRAMSLQILGGVIFVGGILYRFSFLLTGVRTIPFVGYGIMLLGGAIWRYSDWLDD